jgi:oxepin-CoA hydrolase/3-oxo-5,6-dehydrosuberyl-CoA semialdehyde dehydrogenase
MTIPFDVDDPRLRDAFLRDLLLDALAGLRDDAPPRWGRMTAQQMVEHVEWTFDVSSGRATVECTVPEAKRERMKAWLRDNRPSPPDFMNPALAGGLPPLRHAGLAEARAALRAAVDRFLDQARRHPGAIHIHPVFGPISVEEWSRTHFKHGHHHLVQFGLIEPPAQVR